MNAMRATLALLTLLSPMAAELSRAQQTPQTTAAVLPLEAKGISADEAANLSDRLRHELIQTGAFDVMERGKMQEILQEQGFQQSGACNTDRCAIEIGELIGVQKMVAGSVGKIGRTYTVNVRLIDVRTGQIARSVAEDYTGEIDKMLTEVVKRVAGKLALAVHTPGLQTAAAKEGSSIFARWWFWAGIGVAGAGTAALLLGGKDESKPPTTTPTPDQPLDTPPIHPNW